eukprot:GEMP01024175.1.p1 GENE.GEMP01024175.1~~GEMP01024175.1.p1  ORF type:complete len:303 (+),score=61.20 GEMP01024175.1:263-1171(+)
MIGVTLLGMAVIVDAFVGSWNAQSILKPVNKVPATSTRAPATTTTPSTSATTAKDESERATLADKIPLCGSATTEKACFCKGGSREEQCTSGQKCVNGECVDRLADIVPVKASVPCPKSNLPTLFLNDPKYLHSDDDGNCHCPPNYVCYTTEIEDRMMEMRKSAVGDPKALQAIDKLLAERLVLPGCPARRSDHVHWTTSRSKYSWRVRAVCRQAIIAEANDEKAAASVWPYFPLLFGLSLLLMFVLYVFCRGTRPPRVLDSDRDKMGLPVRTADRPQHGRTLAGDSEPRAQRLTVADGRRR